MVRFLPCSFRLHALFYVLLCDSHATGSLNDVNIYRNHVYRFIDGLATPIGTVGTSFALPLDKEFGPYMITALPGYFEQHPDFPDVDWCPFIQNVSADILTPEEKFIACKTRPRTLPKLLDLDLLDNVVEQITTHDYTKGPTLQYFSTALLHQPISYPNEYDVKASDILPDYFQPGKAKPIPSNDDYRMTINQGIRYLDDIFGSTMQAIKDAGQWNNTIVYFTSDNGGPIYTAAAMNNYPLRGMKFTPFEGGTRVVQFMTGGWINQNVPADRRYKSDTNIFANDIAPTLLEMVGADVGFLLGGNKGAPYGNPMWKYIQNSVELEENATKPIQKVRKVIFSKEFFFDVQLNRTLKNIFTGNIPMATPRLWDPIWPKNGDLLMYVCRHYIFQLFLPIRQLCTNLLYYMIFITGIPTIVPFSRVDQMVNHWIAVFLISHQTFKKVIHYLPIVAQWKWRVKNCLKLRVDVRRT